jgi:hypothetical protein
MTKISQYTIDTDVSGSDKWIGSDSQMQNTTKNFTPESLAKYFNDNQVIDTGADVRFKYVVLNVGEERPYGSITFEPQQGNTVAFSDISSFIVSKRNTAGNLVPDFLEFLDDKKIFISKTRDVNTFGYYNVISVEEYEPEPDFYIIAVEFIDGNGGLTKDVDFIFQFVSDSLLNSIFGSGTENYVPRFTSSQDIANGSIYDNGTNIGIGTTVLTEKINIVGRINIVQGSNNVFIGKSCGISNTTGSLNTALGFESFYSNLTGSFNTSFGAASLYFNSSGSYNSAFGRSSLINNTTGIGNAAIGYQSLYSSQIGSFNIAIGYRTLRSSLADKNTAVGAEAMYLNTTGTFNTALGQEALRVNLTGSYNTSIGNFSLLNAEANYVTALGRDAGRFSSSGNLTSSSNSIFLGYNTKSLNSTSTNEIVIGANAVGLGDNKVVIGDNSIVLTALKGSIGIGTTSVNDYSILDVQSTVKGSRPFPMMTEAQRLAMPLVVLPVGLHVYQIDGLQEGVWVYKTLGWQFAY